MPHFSINRKHHHVSYNSKQLYQTPRSIVVGNVEPEKPSKEQMKIMLEDLQAEFDAFRESSSELEQELEKELERVEARARHAENVLQSREEEHHQTTVDLTRQVREMREPALQYIVNLSFCINDYLFPSCRVTETASPCFG